MQVLVLKKTNLFELKDEIARFERENWVKSSNIECKFDQVDYRTYFSIVMTKEE